MTRRLEDRLSALAGGGQTVLAGRGAAAIWLALKAFSKARPGRTGVVLPVTLCTSPAAVTHHAGLAPVFCDTDPATGHLCPNALAALLAARSDVLAVLAAHLYGEPADMAAIRAICRMQGVFLIEDAAQALGADGTGRHGDVTILSFGHTKIIDAGGGGAAVTRDGGLAREMARLAARLPVKPAEVADWAEAYRRTYYAAQSEWDAHPAAKRHVGDACRAYPGLYLSRLEDAQADRIDAALDRLPEVVATRREKAEAYDRAFAELAAPLKRTSAGVPWRYGLMLPPDRREAAAAALRAGGIDASAWYPSLAPFFGDEGAFPGGAAIERGILNLWVDESVDRDRIERSAAIVSNVLTGAAANEARQYG